MVNGDEEDNNRNTNNVVMESYYHITYMYIIYIDNVIAAYYQYILPPVV